MSVEIDPAELSFRRPFTVEVGRILKIKNTNTSPVAFKVKTTAPKQYCVRPNSGRIEPGLDVEVTVLLQAMKSEPPADAKCRDKFLVQSIPITSDKEFENVQQIWDAVDRGTVQERKIRVNWLTESEDGQHAIDVAATPARHSVTNGVDATPEPPPYASPEEHRTGAASTPAYESRSEARSPTGQGASGVVAQAAAAIQPTVDATYEELKEQLLKAQAMVTQLTNDASAGLRQRKAGAPGTDEKGTEPVATQLAQAVRHGTEGVPIRLVAVLCLVCFLLAYFFF